MCAVVYVVCIRWVLKTKKKQLLCEVILVVLFCMQIWGLNNVACTNELNDYFLCVFIC